MTSYFNIPLYLTESTSIDYHKGNKKEKKELINQNFSHIDYKSLREQVNLHHIQDKT